jgi:hypothetical protein
VPEATALSSQAEVQIARRAYRKARDDRKYSRALTKTMLVAVAADQSVVNVGFWARNSRG